MARRFATIEIREEEGMTPLPCDLLWLGQFLWSGRRLRRRTARLAATLRPAPQKVFVVNRSGHRAG